MSIADYWLDGQCRRSSRKQETSGECLVSRNCPKLIRRKAATDAFAGGYVHLETLKAFAEGVGSAIRAVDSGPRKN
jgi:hypothetical protein